MNDPDWIDAPSACALLGVKPQTLYAYVSRHRIRAQADPKDARASLYSKHDVEALARLKRRPRARADVAQAAIRWGDPVLTTSISEVREGTFWVRGHPIEACARDLSLEQAAALLFGVDHIECTAPPLQVSGGSTFSRAMKTLADETEDAPPMMGLSTAEIAVQAGRMMSLVTDACLGNAHSGSFHARAGAAWGLSSAGVDIVRLAMVLLCDHELNPSTFAVRVCASTGGSLPAALLAGMATLSGPRHGGVANLSLHALRTALAGDLATFLASDAGSDPYTFGFGHPLYPDGDPRAAMLLRQIPKDAPARHVVAQIADHVALAPNIDAALAVLTLHLGCPDDAAMAIFSIGRVAGWSAHALEQVQSGSIIRPRAKYQSP